MNNRKTFPAFINDGHISLSVVDVLKKALMDTPIGVHPPHVMEELDHSIGLNMTPPEIEVEMGACCEMPVEKLISNVYAGIHYISDKKGSADIPGIDIYDLVFGEEGAEEVRELAKRGLMIRIDVR